MSDVIKLLPDSVANQIAAGEVIQRPASVIKELVENAVDAGAKGITIVLKDAGKTLIQVVDDGCGMSPTDARMAFERHSTSKITAANDLFALHTMGFRGEALASIAAIAQIDLKTMRRGDTVGTHLIISGSKVESQQPVGTAPGTNMMVKNLFFNVPARRKFLKKDSVELSNILHEFERLALVNPGLDLTIIHNDSTIHQLLASSLKQRIGDLFGKSLERQLIPVETATSLVKISGFVGLPENARRRGALQYLFVNGRNMRHPYFHKAILSCYEQLIRVDEQPNYFINFEVDPATIDVNIHPTKNEIKFENEQPIWQILNAAVRESLGKFNATPAIDFDVDPDSPEIPPFQPDVNALSGLENGTDFNPFETPSKQSKSGGGASWQRSASKAMGDWEQLYSSFNAAVEQQPLPDSDPLFPAADYNDGEVIAVSSRINTGGDDQEKLDLGADTAIGNATMQLRDKYIITPSPQGLLIVDRHRAHVRVLYETFIKGVEDLALPSQKVMFPEAITLTAARTVILNEYREDIEHMGFELTPMTGDTWVINGVPAGVGDTNNVMLLAALLDDLQTGTDIARKSVRSTIALTLARAAAVNASHSLSDTEVEHLLSRLLSLATPTYTPDGLRVLVEVPMSRIESLFA